MAKKGTFYVVGGHGFTERYFRSKSKAKENFTARCIKYAQADGLTPEDLDCESWEEYAEDCWNSGSCDETLDWWAAEFED